MSVADPLTSRDDLEPLAGLRLRTERLELRLGTVDEVMELGRLAEQGIHPRSEMPFGVAWTDATGTATFLDDFAGFHREKLDTWSRDDWELNLLVWANRELVGTQGIGAKQFCTNRTVTTGSWLGARHQRMGIGTEMRSAVLELAFVHLGATAATSGWLEGNAASRRVSEKCGYVETGMSVLRPRGVPVPHHDVRLEAHDWRAPQPVACENIAACLPLFGIAPASGEAADRES
jgi:RimJ/RimL family protein N-acetyltransferase